MALVLSIAHTRSDVLVASTGNLAATLGELSTLLSQATASQLTLDATRTALLPHLQSLERSRILPDQAALLRRFADGGEGLSAEGLAEIVTRIGLIKAAGSPSVQPADVQEALRHLIGPVRSTLLPPPLRSSQSTMRIPVVPEGKEDRIFCPVCHGDNRAEAKFCDQCTEPLVETVRFPSQNREMTFLFTDLKGFDDFSKGLPPDVLGNLVEEVLNGLIRVAISEGGYFIGPWGDAVFLAFGTPDKPMEDHPIRAVRTALKMQEFMRGWSERQVAEGRRGLELRIGINTGTATWTHLRLPQYRRQNGWGEAINISARLEPTAYKTDADGTHQGAIAVSETTLERLEGRFDSISMGETTVKSRTIRYHLVTAERPQASLLMPKGREQIRFIGRQAEIEVLKRDLWETVDQKRSRLTIVSGGPGLGKTRLGMEFVEEIGRSEIPVRVVAAHGEDLPAVPPFQAISRAIERMCGMENRDSEEDRRQKLLSLVQRTIAAQESDLELTTQLLGNLIGVEFETVHPVIRSLQNSASDLRERTLDAISTLFDHASRRRPVVFLVEDLQWVDRGSVRYLQVLLERLKDKPFFVVALTRPELLSADSPLLAGAYPIRRIDLGALSSEDLRLMAEEVLGEVATSEVRRDVRNKGLREEVSIRVWEFLALESLGNPYALQEMARSVRDGWRIEGEVKQDPEGQEGIEWHLIAPDGKRIPAGTRGFLQARVDHLPEDHQRLLRAASVVGAKFSTGDMEALGLTGMEGILEELSQQSLLIPAGEGHYQFPHALLRETAYSQIPLADRQVLHWGAASHLIQGDSEEFALIAHHMEQGNEREHSAAYCLKAAEAAAKMGAYRSAATFYEKTHDLSGDSSRRLQALFGWEESLYRDRRYGEAVPLLEEFDALIPSLQPAEREDLATLRFHKARILIALRRDQEAEAEILEGLRPYQKSETAAVKCRLLSLLGGIHSRIRKDLQRALGSYLHQLETARRLGDPHQIGAALVDVARMEDSLGRRSEALGAAREAMEYCRTGVDLRETLRAYNTLSTILILIGCADEALPLLRQAIEMSRKYLGGDRLDLLFLTSAQAAVFLRRYDEAIAFLEEALPIHEDRSPDQITNETHLHLALAYAGKEDWPKALEAAEQALRVAESIHDDSEAAKDRTIMARSYLGMGRLKEALVESTKAMEIREGVKSKRIEQFDEEVLLTNIQVLMALGRHEEAFDFADRAKRQIQANADRITNDDHRRSFLTQVPYHREILKLWQLLKEMTSRELLPPVKTHLAELNAYPPAVLPEEVWFATAAETEKIAKTGRDGLAVAGAVIPFTFGSVFASLLQRPLKIARNPWELPLFWAKDIECEPLFDQRGRFFYHPRWDYGSILDAQEAPADMHATLSLLISQLDREELLEGRIYDRGGAVFIELVPSPQGSVTTASGATVEVDPERRPKRGQFGRIRFILVPTLDEKTIVVMEMGKALYTLNPAIFLEAFIRETRNSATINSGKVSATNAPSIGRSE